MYVAIRRRLHGIRLIEGIPRMYVRGGEHDCFTVVDPCPADVDLGFLWVVNIRIDNCENGLLAFEGAGPRQAPHPARGTRTRR